MQSTKVTKGDMAVRQKRSDEVCHDEEAPPSRTQQSRVDQTSFPRSASTSTCSCTADELQAIDIVSSKFAEQQPKAADSSSSAHAANAGTSAQRQFPSLRTSTKSPSQTLEAVYSAGKYKASLRLDVLCVQSFMAGLYIAMAGQLFLSVGGGILGASLFATGLLGVILTSAELFTGDALIFVASFLGDKVKAKSVLRNWSVSWLLNFVGCLTWAYVIGYASDALQDLDKAQFAIATAEKKASQGFLGTFLKGIAANFMVCVGVWQATCAEEVSGKILALWFPITGFVASAFDHCIANQFFFPLGMFLGADISIGNMFFKLLAATLGNIVGGGLFVGGIYWYVFDSMLSLQQLKGRIRTNFNTQRASMILRRSSVAPTKRSMSRSNK